MNRIHLNACKKESFLAIKKITRCITSSNPSTLNTEEDVLPSSSSNYSLAIETY